MSINVTLFFFYLKRDLLVLHYLKQKSIVKPLKMVLLSCFYVLTRLLLFVGNTTLVFDVGVNVYVLVLVSDITCVTLSSLNILMY